ncbi:hypothetical protein C0989_006357, partial [Termitomyces sp. Mn162]
MFARLVTDDMLSTTSLEEVDWEGWMATAEEEKDKPKTSLDWKEYTQETIKDDTST